MGGGQKNVHRPWPLAPLFSQLAFLLALFMTNIRVHSCRSCKLRLYDSVVLGVHVHVAFFKKQELFKTQAVEAGSEAGRGVGPGGRRY